MKRSPAIIALILLLCLSVIPVSAADTGVTIQSQEAAVGEIVYLPLSLAEPQEANTVGISLTFDRSALEFMAGMSSWSISGSIQNFDRQKEYALWSDSKTQKLSGELCRLAFRVREGAKPSQCGVTCSVVLKIDSQEVASYTATGEITLPCQHSYGQWTKLDASAHSRTCHLCGSEEYGSHQWDEGTVTREPTQTQPGTQVFACQDCGAEREQSVPPLGGSEETGIPIQTAPTRPQSTEPQATRPTTEPTRPQSSEPQTTRPTQPNNPSGSSGISTQPTSGNGNAEESQPLIIPKEDVVVIKPNETTQTTEAPEQTLPETEPAEEPLPEEQEAPAWIILVVIACLLAGVIGFWLVQKRKK